MPIKIRKFTQVVLAATFFTACLFGQTVSSALEGTVVDQTDAVVPSAPVTLTSTETGASRAAVTDSNGQFRFLDLAPGTYSLSIKAAGFKSIRKTRS
jgi:hypothetical protein